MIVSCLATYQTAIAQRIAQCEEAQALYNQANYTAALAKQEECIAAKPLEGVGYYFRGRIRYQMKEVNKALEDYEKATRLAPDFVQSYYALSQHYLGNKDMDNALKWVSAAILAKPDMASNYNFRGWIYFNFDKYLMAFKDFSKAIELDPKDASAYNNRGSARYNIQNVDLASDKDLQMSRVDYEKALSLDSTLPNLYRNLGYVALLLHEDSTALYWLNKANRRNPDDAMVFLYKGMVYAHQGNNSYAVVELDNALHSYNQLAEAYFEKGKVMYNSKVYSKAKANFEKAIELKEGLKAESYYYLAKISATQFEQDKMMEHLKEANRAGYFKRQEQLVNFLKEPVFNDFKNYKPFVALLSKLRGG